MNFLALKIPPVILVALFALLMWLVSQSFSALIVTIPYHNYLACLLMVTGFLIAFSGICAFRKAKTTVDPRTPEKASSLVNSGVYKVTRNPMYLGFLCGLIAYAIYLSHLLAFSLLPLFIIYMTAFQIKPEEQMLVKLFGEQYQNYCQSVRRWL